MVKVSSSDILAILRKFDLADEQNLPRQIERINFTHPAATNTLASFKFQQKSFFILYDDTAEDRQAYILDQVAIIWPSLKVKLLLNPRSDLTTFGLPFKGKDVYLLLAESDKARLDSELARRWPDVSRSTWQKHIKQGRVTVDGKVETLPKREILPSSVINIDLPNRPDATNFELPILYIDDDVVVINKPTGILTHAKGAIADELTVADFLRRYISSGEDDDRSGIVHRLDRQTSGVIIGARHPVAADFLKKQFAERRAKKTYKAVVIGQPKMNSARIDLPIARNPSAPSTFKVAAGGKAALTDYKLLKSNQHYSLLELKPLTGRTHQLRVHMQYLKTPILGDMVYGGGQAERLFLHAESLEITLPSGTSRKFEAPLAPIFEEVLDGEVDL